ncbi:hypothetical protein [Pseudonocardia acaciae]|uniref:hypothetical protein n=1 Tax=Pseudonocardia acaciae TaxID=551276 RepID=UPI000AC00A0C|nr:hypothetical protein [Pseudonocardia acaciae]
MTEQLTPAELRLLADPGTARGRRPVDHEPEPDEPPPGPGAASTPAVEDEETAGQEP